MLKQFPSDKTNLFWFAGSKPSQLIFLLKLVSDFLENNPNKFLCINKVLSLSFSMLSISILHKNLKYKKNSNVKKNIQKHSTLSLIRVAYMSWSTRFLTVEACWGLFIFHSVSFSLKFLFLFNNRHGFFDFKMS